MPQHYTAAEADIDDLLLAELGRLGVDPEAIRIVVVTHLHNDHVGGVPHFPAATFYMQEAELREAVSTTAAVIVALTAPMQQSGPICRASSLAFQSRRSSMVTVDLSR